METQQSEAIISAMDVRILYRCDGAGCSAFCGLESEYCHHTTNIEHAKNFERIQDGDRTIYIEKGEVKTCRNCKWFNTNDDRCIAGSYVHHNCVDHSEWEEVENE